MHWSTALRWDGSRAVARGLRSSLAYPWLFTGSRTAVLRTGGVRLLTNTLPASRDPVTPQIVPNIPITELCGSQACSIYTVLPAGACCLSGWFGNKEKE